MDDFKVEEIKPDKKVKPGALISFIACAICAMVEITYCLHSKYDVDFFLLYEYPKWAAYLVDLANLGYAMFLFGMARMSEDDKTVKNTLNGLAGGAGALVIWGIWSNNSDKDYSTYILTIAFVMMCFDAFLLYHCSQKKYDTLKKYAIIMLIADVFYVFSGYYDINSQSEIVRIYEDYNEYSDFAFVDICKTNMFLNVIGDIFCAAASAFVAFSQLSKKTLV